MAGADEDFLSRWSRRKQSRPADGDEVLPDGGPDGGPEGGPEGGSAAEAAGPDGQVDPDAGDPEVVARLPDIDEMDESSDFAAFLAKGVPEALQRRALRKLWRLNPLFANLDGLNDYDEDFTISATLAEGVKTIYKVGRGMISKDPEPDDQDAPATAESADPEDAEAAQTAHTDQEAPADSTPPREKIISEAAVPAPGPDVAAAVSPGDERKPSEEPAARAPGSGRSAAARRWDDSAG